MPAVKEWTGMDFTEQVACIKGDLVLAIGRGEDIAGVIGKWLMHISREAYERGLAEGRKKRGKCPRERRGRRGK